MKEKSRQKIYELRIKYLKKKPFLFSVLLLRNVGE